MKSIRVDEDPNKKLKTLAKVFGMTSKSCLNVILMNINQDDMLMLLRRNIEPIVTSTQYDSEFKPEKIDDDEDWEPAIFEEDDEFSEEDYEVEGFSPAEVKRKQLELAAIKANIVSKDEIDEFIDENDRD